MPRKRRLSVLTTLCIALASPSALAATISQLPTIRVTGIRPAIGLDQPGTTSIIDRRQIDRQLVSDIRELVRYEPGVSAIGTAGRFGLDSFNIRGLSGNRTYMEIDGLPVPDSFGADIAGGGFRAGRNFIDMDSIKQVEIIRGPVSPLYPSDALGGAVIITTRAPSDYLGPDRPVHAFVREQYDSASRSFATTALLAAGNQRHGFLLSANHRDGHETGNKGNVGGTGAERTRPDPMDYRNDGLLARYVHHADSGREDRVSVRGTRRDTRTNGLSELVPDPHTGVTPRYYRSHDTDSQASAMVGQQWTRLDAALADVLDWHAYWQQTLTRTRTATDTPEVARYFDTVPVNERVIGARLLATKHAGDAGPVTQTIRYGIDATRTHVESRADGYGVDKQTGAIGSSNAFLPGNYPMHLVPPSHTDRFALFGQDRIDLVDGRLTITAGVRAERYAYRPQADALYQQLNRGYLQRDYTRNHVSPKLGMIWRFNDVLSLHADYADGFRPPLYSELSGAWNEQPFPGLNIAFLPSPGLDAETSRNLEIGLRGYGNAFWFDVTAYYNRYRDFIWTGYALPASQVPPWAYQISPGAFLNAFYQAVNAPRAVIKGIEASGQVKLGAFGEALQGWSLRATAALASGELVAPGTDSWSPLNSVDPARLVVGIAYEGTRWGMQLVGTGVRRHTRLSDPDAFRPPGYGTLDFYTHWKPADNVVLYFGARNLTDRKYWDWGSLNGGTLGNFLTGNGINDAGTGGIPADRLTMPGRSISVAARISF